MGDDLYGKEDLTALAGEDMAVLAKMMPNPFSAGILHTDEQGNLLEIIEKTAIPEIGLMNTGAYALTQDFFEYELVPISDTEFGLPQTLACMTKKYPVKVVSANLWLQVGKPEDIPNAEVFLRDYDNL